MPDIPGRMKSEGYISPAPPYGAPKEVKIFMAKTYGGIRKNRYPGEDPEAKMHAARITWYQTRRKFGKKYPHLFKKHDSPVRSHSTRHVRNQVRSSQDNKIIKTPNFVVSAVKPAKTEKGRRIQVSGLHAASRREIRYAQTAENESISETKLAKRLKKKGASKEEIADVKHDAKLAYGFAEDRKELAKEYDVQAARIAAIGDE